mmetsp:Transcript_31295/g.28463  ORF Transcript_31295/g.28463 Transcript_31295/m.28463 type:complete len:216 (+) Transcript_31295:2660-3307(+)
MLSFARNQCIRKHTFQILIQGISIDPFCNEEFNGFRESIHELSSWSDSVAIKFAFKMLINFFRNIHTFFLPFLSQIFLLSSQLLCFLSCSKSSTSLLIHLGPWGNTINSKIDQLFWFYNINDHINVFENVIKHFFFSNWTRDWQVFRMSTRMDNTIHIKIQVIHFNLWPIHVFWIILILFRQFIYHIMKNFRASHAEILEKCWNSHSNMARGSMM